jgi:hypothetical protein
MLQNMISTPAAALPLEVYLRVGCTLSNQGGTLRFTNISGGTLVALIVLMVEVRGVAASKMYCQDLH